MCLEMKIIKSPKMTKLLVRIDKSKKTVLHANEKQLFAGGILMNFPGLPGISGMVKVASNQFLVIHDTKGPLGARLGGIEIQKEGPKYQELGICNWPIYEDLPNDLEGICLIPERPGEYLIVESGFYPKYGHFGRVIKIRFPIGTPGTVEYLGSFRPLPAPPNKAETPRPEQIEGIAVVAHEGIIVLLLALRGGKQKPDDEVVQGQLIWGTLTEIETPNPSFEPKGSSPLTYQPIADRGAADLYVVPNPPNNWDIYSVATSDPGDFGDKKDLGPFRSAIYLAGTLSISGPEISFSPQQTEQIVHWDFDGLKVEAIAPSAEIFNDYRGLSIATDDELYNGIWRPISRSRETRYPSPLLFSKEAKIGFALK
jgi:hypothetical protein